MSRFVSCIDLLGIFGIDRQDANTRIMQSVCLPIATPQNPCTRCTGRQIHQEKTEEYYSLYVPLSSSSLRLLHALYVPSISTTTSVAHPLHVDRPDGRHGQQ